MSIYKLSPNVIISKLKDLVNYIDTDVKHILVLSSPTVHAHPCVLHFIENVSETYKTTVFNKIKPDAPIDDLQYLIDTVAKPDLIIAIGGGSVIDSAKALSIGWQGKTIIDFFYSRQELPTTNIPVYAVPTTAGTGAELSYGAIIYDKNAGVKGGIRGELLQPNKVLLDIDLYAFAPAKLIAEVGFDCLTHAIETYVSTASSPIVEYQSVASINVVFTNLKKAVSKNQIALQKMAIAATMMGANLALSTTCLPHRIQYALGPFTNTTHAQGLIVLYKGWLKEVSTTDKFAMLANDLGLTVDKLIAKIQLLKQDLQIDYNLMWLGANQADIAQIAAKVTGNLNTDPCYKSIDTILNILKNSI
ncbi:iron-containing alcohol dehydrogenase family protein [Mucilaginibacter boryungensis]|uniref:Iron-containing alcohol dehydrogenase n=1 Tax=Mucilaginibacter boryungensis TaxID=768480 RepID=A0ABR9XKU8_9SPHI|nr:iron-containing alcohol dehydrogenase [Mucilaginibacter boryungensis]MBE9667891.1 iron-containing alcohol dehydrogenase [Mucilaginibacter boryungensis]